MLHVYCCCQLRYSRTLRGLSCSLFVFLSFHYLDSPIVAFHAQVVFKFLDRLSAIGSSQGLSLQLSLRLIFSNSRYPSPAACPPAVLDLYSLLLLPIQRVF